MAGLPSAGVLPAVEKKLEMLGAKPGSTFTRS
jgi:hypothetical protein